MNCSIVFAFLFALVSATAQMQYENRFLNDFSTVNYYRNQARSIPSYKQQFYNHYMNKANNQKEAFETMKAFGGQKTGRRGNRFARNHYLRNM
jgi:hypothetical protein